ncbi:replication protein, partial [uncultured marine virus]
KNTEGVILNPPRLKKVCKYRAWVYTLNNWTDTEYTAILDYCKKGSKKYIIGKEIGESGTPHLQGYIFSKNAIKFDTLKKVCDRLHLEKAKGSMQDNRKYCSKDLDFVSNIPIPRKERLLRDLYKGVIWKWWQQDIIDLVSGETDNRIIHWFWEPDGNVGKSFYISIYI